METALLLLNSDKIEGFDNTIFYLFSNPDFDKFSREFSAWLAYQNILSFRSVCSVGDYNKVCKYLNTLSEGLRDESAKITWKTYMGTWGCSVPVPVSSAIRCIHAVTYPTGGATLYDASSYFLGTTSSPELGKYIRECKLRSMLMHHKEK